MTAPLLNISGKIDPALVELCVTVTDCATQLQIPYLGWDITLAAAHQLGIDARKIASPQTHRVIAEFLNNQNKRLFLERLINEMDAAQQYSRNEVLIKAFSLGFLN